MSMLTDEELRKLREFMYGLSGLTQVLTDTKNAAENLTSEMQVLNSKFDNYVTQKEFLDHMKEAEPLMAWVRARMANERLISWILGFIGFSNLALIIGGILLVLSMIQSGILHK